MSPSTQPRRSIHLAVDLSGASLHATAPEAARDVGPVSVEPLARLVATARRGDLDFVLLEDTATPGTGDTAAWRGRLDPTLVASHLARRVPGIGLAVTVETTHTEPFHLSKAIATLDHVSEGRAAWQVAWSTSPITADRWGRPVPSEGDAVAEAVEVVAVMRRLWDSWEDDAEIRDAATSRFIDRDKLHYVDFEGRHFSVKGPSITPRPPQGQPPVIVALPGAGHAQTTELVALAGSEADVVRIRATSPSGAAALRDEVHAAARRADRDPEDVRVLVDVLTALGADRAGARTRLELFREIHGVEPSEDSLTHTGTPESLAFVLREWVAAGAADGFVVHPVTPATDLELFVAHAVPALQVGGLFRAAYPGRTLRDTLGLDRPANRFAARALEVAR